MPNLQDRIQSMYRSDVRGAWLLTALLWVVILFVLFMSWPHIPSAPVKLVVTLAAAAVLIFNTAAILAMVRIYTEDKDFIYGLDIQHLDASRSKRG